MRFAYADPPYIGQAKKHYSHEELCEEVDHTQLIRKLLLYDGWALSCSSPSLKHILALCPEDVRVASWVKPFASFKPGINPAYCWEPVLWYSSRKRTREQITCRDWIDANITLKRGLVGVKPNKFCYWLFELLNIEEGDTLDDMFPGSFSVTLAFNNWMQAKKDVYIQSDLWNKET